jgi:Kef-type K+ transport system membrane component KefB/Trk K+ transport system NAD-binding subunit
MTADGIFLQLSMVIVIGAVVSVIMRALRQPLILGYILTGVVVGPAVFNLLRVDTFDAFASIGIALLLFIIGLGMNISVIKRLGGTVFITTAIELLTVGSVGFVVSSLLGFGRMESLIIGLCLFFSSTIIIVKMLTDKKEQNRLHGQIAIGIILLDDIVATVALLLIAGAKDHTLGVGELGLLAVQGAALAAFLILASVVLLPKITRFVAGSQEMLFLFAIGWGFGVASLFQLAGFSIELGALFAGVALAGLPYAQEIEARLKPLRDFFVVLFFIVLGKSLTVAGLSDALLPALALSAVVVVLKPVTIVSALGMMGYSKRVSFMAGIHLSQISEFSIVLAVLASATGLASKEIGTVITLVAIITIACSSYLAHYDNGLFKLFSYLRLDFFERANVRREKRRAPGYQLVLVGYSGGGNRFVKTFQQLHKRFLVIDYDPAMIELMQQLHVPCLYGDATDNELLDEIGIQSAKLLVSTVSDFETNSQLVRHLNLLNPEAVIVCNASSTEEALQLYELGSSYVIIPHHASSEHLNSLIQRNGIDRRHFDRYREKHLHKLGTFDGQLAEAEAAA